jgi:acyl carrier protein
VAYVVPAQGAAFTDTELRRHLRRCVGRAGIPQHIVSVEVLPRRPDGTLDLRLLPTPFATRRRESRPPQTDEEKLLVALWSETLGVPHVSLEDNFFDLGGHSLLSLQLVSRIEAQTHRRLKPRLLLLSTLEQVAAELARAEVTAD